MINPEDNLLLENSNGQNFTMDITFDNEDPHIPDGVDLVAQEMAHDILKEGKSDILILHGRGLGKTYVATKFLYQKAWKHVKLKLQSEDKTQEMITKILKENLATNGIILECRDAHVLPRLPLGINVVSVRFDCITRESEDELSNSESDGSDDGEI